MKPERVFIMKDKNQIAAGIKKLDANEYLSEYNNDVADVMPYKEYLDLYFDKKSFKDDIIELFESEKEIIVDFGNYEFFALAYENGVENGVDSTQFGIDINDGKIFVYID